MNAAWRGLRLFPALLLVLLLAACSMGEEADRPTPTEEAEPAIVVATVAAPEVSATPPPTEVPTAEAAPTPTPTPTPPAPLAAQVNGQYIFLADYEQRVADYEQALVAQGHDPDSADGQEFFAQARRDVLEGLIDGALIEQGAGEMGIYLDEETLEGQLLADIEAGGGQTAFEEWLAATGQTREDYKESLRQSLIAQRVMEAVTAGVPASVEQVHARHIEVESEEEARQIRSELEAGADFAALARERSIDLATRDNGGDLGWFPRGLVAPELENAAFALQPGQFSDVIQLGEGYHIIQVVEREAARLLSAETQVDLRRAVFEQWLAERRAAAEIERFVGE
jgi:parvulin-like peptidyl-prolyl isomerase